MHVAVDEQIFAIQPYGGISRLFAELIRQFTSDPSLGVTIDALGAPIVNRYILDDPGLSAHLGVRSARNQWTALAWYFSHVQRKRTDVVHSTFYLPHGLASPRGTRHVVTVHDMIPERLPTTRRRLDLLTLKKRYIFSADHVICVSEATRRDLLSVYPELDTPVTVIHHGVDDRFHVQAPRLERLPEHYVLHVGHRGQYKDATTLIRAFARLAPDFPNLHLVFVGGGPLTREESSLATSLGILDRIMQIDLSDEVMPSAYANADVFVMPSRFEGFGIPVLEAMACGTPTLLADATSLPEVGGDAARYFPVSGVEELSDLLDAVLTSPEVAQRMSAAGVTRARDFTWKRTARETADVYRRVLA